MSSNHCPSSLLPCSIGQLPGLDTIFPAATVSDQFCACQYSLEAIRSNLHPSSLLQSFHTALLPPSILPHSIGRRQKERGNGGIADGGQRRSQCQAKPGIYLSRCIFISIINYHFIYSHSRLISVEEMIAVITRVKLPRKVSRRMLSG